ncbi:MAG: alpha/beta hydrolase [Microthrixaceae bacterium]|nr:alpha/beta hydrolase [Microthrixaceae bacterium]
MKLESFEDVDGVEVWYRCWAADAEPRGAVVIAHGASEHSGRYGRFAEALNMAGLTVCAIDHRGHGVTAQSTGAGMPGPRGMEGVLDDLAQMVDIAAAEVNAPVILFGHSMGSLFVQALVERGGKRFAGYVLSGCMGPLAEGMGELVDALEAAADAGMGDEPLDVLGPFNEAFEPARTPYDWLSRDESEVDASIADPLCGDDMALTYRYAAGMMNLIRDSMSAEGVARTPSRTPVLLITGSMDPVSNMGAQVRVLEEGLRAAGAEVSSIYYQDARHEVLNETNRDGVTADVIEWIDSVIGSP